MPTVSVTVELSLDIDDSEQLDPVALEAAAAAEGRRAARALLAAGLERIDELLVATLSGVRQRREPRWLHTTVGRLRLWRWRVRDCDGVSRCVLDQALGWSQAEPSRGLAELLCDLALRVPFRQAAEIASRFTGDVVTHQSAWRAVQHEGIGLRADEDAAVAALFDDAVQPDREGPSPPLVVIEADGTFVRAQGEPDSKFEVKTGIMYTGKHAAGGRRHRRFALTDKRCVATVADADTFGKRLYLQGCRQLGLHRAGHVLAVHDVA